VFKEEVMPVTFKNIEGTINTGAPEVGANNFTDERFRYELMWTGGFHEPAKEQEKLYKDLGLLTNGKVPTVRKVPIDINHNDGSGSRWYTDNKNFRTLGRMEAELGLSSVAIMEAWGYGRPDKPLHIKYGCEQCSFECGSEEGLTLHVEFVHNHDKTITKTENITKSYTENTDAVVEGVTTSAIQGNPRK
jgi:hypothetical protein